MAFIFALLLIGVLLLPCAKGMVEAINQLIFERESTSIEVIIVWLFLMLLFAVTIGLAYISN